MKAYKLYKLFQWQMILIALSVILFIGAFWITEDFSRINAESKHQYQISMKSKRQLIKEETQRLFKFIQYKIAQTENHLKLSIKQNTYEAIDIATNIYNQNKFNKSNEEIGKMIRDALRPVRFNNGRGYYFAVSLDGVEQLYPIRPEYEGKNLLSLQDSKGNYVIRDEIDVIKKSNEGFVKHFWTKPDKPKKILFPKISFVKYFEPLNWYIGTGDYLDDVEKDLQVEILDWIGSVRYGETGYFFVHNYDGVNLSHIDLSVIGKNVSHLQDKNGLKFIDELTKISRQNEGGFLQYIGHYDPRTKQPGEKISFARSVPDWEWVVGTGIYIDQLATIEKQNAKIFKLKLRDSILKISLAIIIALLIIYTSLRIVSGKFTKNFQIFNTFFEEAASNEKPVDLKKLDFLEFVSLGKAANKMLEHRKKVELEKSELEEKLRQSHKMEAVGRLAGGVAHDFNNMLSIILGNSEIVLEDIEPDNHLIQNINEIQKAARRSSDLTRQLLAFARKQTISPRILDLNATIEGMLKMLRRLIGEDIDLSWRPKNGLWQTRIDPSQVDQILVNLCVNARDAIQNVGKVTIETDNIHLEDHPFQQNMDFKPGDYVVLLVSDNGCGMDKETVDNLFEPFFTTKEVGDGTGLGMATVYGIVRQNNGFINIYSELEKGTTFKIYLPKQVQKQSDRVQKISEKKILKGDETILLVEDEKAILDTTQMMLERLGYTVLPALSPEDALEVVKKRIPDDIHLLMTDVVMPKMNGRDLSKELIKLCPNLKCLFMSGYTANVIAHHGVLDEGLHFINKPYSKQDLSIKLREILDKSSI